LTRALHLAREGPGVDIDAAQRAAAERSALADPDVPLEEFAG
jgi:hypothetical protein